MVLPQRGKSVCLDSSRKPSGVANLCATVGTKIGVDLIEVGKVKEIMERNRSLKEAIFTSEELHDSFGWRDSYVHLAACFTAKEALFKALGTGLSGTMDWRDVEVFGGNSVKPMLRLSGATARVAEEQGVVSCTLSLTHTRRLAAALILLVLEISKQNVGSNITF